MSTEKSPLLVLGWSQKDSEDLTQELLPIANKFNIEHDNDELPNILVENSYIFVQNMSKELYDFCTKNEIEIVSGADNNEDGDWYFGFGVPAIYETQISELISILDKLNLVMLKTLKNVDISEPKLYNVISWF